MILHRGFHNTTMYMSIQRLKLRHGLRWYNFSSPVRLPRRQQPIERSTPRKRRISSNNTTEQATLHDEKNVDAAQIAAYKFYAKQRGITSRSASNKNGFWSRLYRKVVPLRWQQQQQHAPERVSTSQKNMNTAWYALAVAIGALGASYAAVPLYKVFCQTTGFGGTTQRVLTSPNDDDEGYNSTMEVYLQRLAAAVLPAGTAARVHTWTDADAIERLRNLKPLTNSDMITVRFDTTVTDIMPWSFVPVQLDVKVVPGETALSFFRVTNHSDKAITGVATYNVHPPKVGLYFQKIQCFCFEEQRLLPHETVDMPVFFFIDPEIADDPQVSYVRSVTLSYTFFPTDEDEDDIQPVVIQNLI
jgi:cytochrome c oxidase assembly protein subunit 11